MSGDLLILIELGLVFLLAFGWGFNELRQLKKYKKKRRYEQDERVPPDSDKE